MNYNKVVLMGHVRGEPRDEGSWIAIELEISRKYRDSNDQLKEEIVRVEARLTGKLRDQAKYLRERSPVLVDGRLAYISWETPSGEHRSKLVVTVENLHHVGRNS